MRTTGTHTLLQKGIAAHREGRMDAAVAAYRAVLSIQPRNATAHNNLGLIALDGGDARSAVSSILHALEILPGNADFVFNLAQATGAAGWPEEALQLIARYLAGEKTAPLHLYSILAEGLAFHRTAADEAMLQLAPALQLAETSPEDWHNLAFHLLQLNCLDTARAAVERSLQQTTGMGSESHAQRLLGLSLKAAILRALGHSDEARQCLMEAVEIAPGHAPSWNNLATLYRDQAHFLAADDAVRRALAIAPDYPAALSTEASIAIALQDFPRARSSCENALRQQPDFAEAHWNLALACLAQGDFARGWAEYEWRRQLPGSARLFPELGLPVWQGQPLVGKTLLLHAEQGHGDTLQFIRLAESLTRQGVRVVAMVQPALVRLLARSPYLAEVLPQGGPVPAADYCLPIMSLPHRLGLSVDSIPAGKPYLFPLPEEIAAWRERLAAWPDPRVGLVWAGDPRPDDPESNRIDRRRSLSFADLRPILDLPGFSFVSLQKGDPAAQLVPQANLFDPTAELLDFADTAALVANLDVVVSVDTAVAHLAAALGVPTLLLSRFDACWRWLGNQQTSPWYPALSLFPQTAPGQWQHTISSVANALKKAQTLLCIK